MEKTDTSWYEKIGTQTGKSIEEQVKCNYFASAISARELGDVEISCDIPIIKLSYCITDRSDNMVKEGIHTFEAGGVNRFSFKETLPLESFQAYETENADYRIMTSVTLISGQEVGGHYAFKANLRSGETTTDMPATNLKEQLAAIPIARPGMTEEELRKICLDFIKLEAEVPFKVDKDFEYVVFSQNHPRKLLRGKVYGGIPYVTRGAGNLYRFAEIYDSETGTLDTQSDVFEDIRYFGNACSGSASMAWSRVVTSAYLGYTMFMTEANGFLPVGPYRYSRDNVTMFIRKGPNSFHCKTICTENGEQTMYESYAQMKPADGLVCNRHVRMNSAVPTVVRNADGSIDGEKSYTFVREQVCYTFNRNHIRVACDGSHYVAQGAVDLQCSFRDLFEKDYIPFTFAEFADPSRVEPARIRLAVEPELKDRVLTANYGISDVFAEVDGKRYVYRNMEFFRKEVKLGDIFPEEALTEQTRIFCQLLNGQLIEVLQ